MTTRYGDAEREQLAELVHGHAGFEWAIARAVSALPTDATHIVHFGCGIGWLTAEISRSRRKASVTGIDPSLSAIQTARALFANDRLRFEIGDLATSEPGPGLLAEVLVLSSTQAILLSQARSEVVRAASASTADRAAVLLHLRDPRKSPRASTSASAEPSADLKSGLRELAEALGGKIAFQATSDRGNDTQSIVLIQRGYASQPASAGHARDFAIEGKSRRRARESQGVRKSSITSLNSLAMAKANGRLES